MVVPDLGNYRECCSRWFTYGSAAPIADPIGSHYQLFKTESMGSLPNCASPRFKYLDHMRRYHANSALVRHTAAREWIQLLENGSMCRLRPSDRSNPKIRAGRDEVLETALVFVKRAQ
jgi:hypothetical protein